MKLNLKIRIDRLNGLGEYIFLSDKVIGSAIDGFFDALGEKSGKYNYGNLKKTFIGFFRQFDLDQLINIGRNILESMDCADMEKQVISGNLEPHCRILHSIFKKL